MPYIYDDEDNYPMIDDDRQGYRLEMMAEARREAEQEEKKKQQQEALDGLALVLGLSEKCRKCPYFYETAEGFLDNENQISTEQMEYLKIQCAGCKGQANGFPDPNHEERLDKEWKDLCEWVKDIIQGTGPKVYRCQYCPNVYRVYGKYKDPDDEWKAIEDLCCNCKYFGEDDP